MELVDENLQNGPEDFHVNYQLSWSRQRKKCLFFPILFPLCKYVIRKQSLVTIFVDKAFLVILETRYRNRENTILLASPSPEGTILDEKYTR